MQSAITLAIVGMGASASAIVPPRIFPRNESDTANTFTLQAYGKASGPIGQLFDGQNRIGGKLPLGYYTISHGPKGGVISDKNGRGCILTPPTTQFQCDEGVGGTPGFDISCDKHLLYNGSSEFWACPVDDHGVWNLYTKPNFAQKKCITITLGVHGDSAPHPSCKQPVPSPPSPHGQDCTGKNDSCKSAPPHPAPTPPCKGDCNPASPPPPPCNDDKCKPIPPPIPSCGDGKNKGDCKHDEELQTCPADLEGPYEFPHLIVPVDKSSPDKAFGTKLNGTFSDDTCSIFNFDIHPDFSGKTCTLTFLLPKQEDLETSAYTFETWGEDAGVQFYTLKKPASLKTTWNNVGEKQLVAEGPVYPDLAVGAYTHKCPAGKKESIMVCGNDVYLDYFQDFNPSPIGLYIRTC